MRTSKTIFPFSWCVKRRTDRCLAMKGTESLYRRIGTAPSLETGPVSGGLTCPPRAVRIPTAGHPCTRCGQHRLKLSGKDRSEQMMRRRLKLLAILSFTLLILLLAFEPWLHNHSHGEGTDNECLACKWLNDLSASFITFFLVTTVFVIQILSVPRRETASFFASGSSSIRAPPAPAFS
jgi:hypothetical protein